MLLIVLNKRHENMIEKGNYTKNKLYYIILIIFCEHIVGHYIVLFRITVSVRFELYNLKDGATVIKFHCGKFLL